MKCRAEVNVAEAAKAGVQWEFPCFARSVTGNGLIFRLYGPEEPGSASGFEVESGEGSRTWSLRTMKPVPKAESAAWRVVIDAKGCRLEKGAVEAEEPAKPEYPYLMRGRGGLLSREISVLRLDDTVSIIGRGWSVADEGDVMSRGKLTEELYEPCEGSVTVTNRPGVEFPRLYAMDGAMDWIAIRVARDHWWCVRDGRFFRLRNCEGATDACRLQKEPVDMPLPDGSGVTLTFSE